MARSSMLLTKHAAELCALLVNDLYGELPSRIVVALLTKGRSSIAQLAHNTGLGPRHIRNGLGILVQQNLLYYQTSTDSSAMTYEANPLVCYNLVRYGKILEIVHSQYGSAERDLVQTLMHLGHARIGDLYQAFGSRNPKVNGHTNGSHESSTGLIDSEGSLQSALARLIRAEIIETLRPDSFRNPMDVYQEIKLDVTKTLPGEKATSKNKVDHQGRIVDRYRTFKNQSKLLKQQLDQSQGPATKRRKLEHGIRQNGHTDDSDALSQLDPSVIVKLNHERCLVELRNQRLASFAADSLGEVTGKVYRVLLKLSTVQVPKCRPDPLLEEGAVGAQAVVTTTDIYESLDAEFSLGGMGKAPRDKIDFRSAERVRPAPPDSEDESIGSGNESHARGRQLTVVESDDDDESDEDDDSGAVKPQNGRSPPVINGGRHAKVKFEDDPPTKDSRLDQMRRHLLLLAESKHRFIRHCGTLGKGQWTVDTEQVMNRLRDSELDAFIEHSYGRHGLRLTRILREKGKLDEKMLHTAALMRKSDVQGKMLAMQMSGIVDVQEVPKDNMRLANRTMFFWFFDSEKIQSHLLDDVYKAMLRCLQTLQVERHKERHILSFVDRKDVKGKEEEVMTPEHYNKYNRHLELQDKLLGQVMRLDDMVGAFRDF